MCVFSEIKVYWAAYATKIYREKMWEKDFKKQLAHLSFSFKIMTGHNYVSCFDSVSQLYFPHN